MNKGHKIDTSSRVRKTVANAAPTIKKKCTTLYEDEQEKDEKRFTKTWTHDHESPRELALQTDVQRKLGPQSEENVRWHKCNLKKSRLLIAQDTQQKLEVAFLRRTQLQLGELINEQKNNLLPRIYDFHFSNI